MDERDYAVNENQSDQFSGEKWIILSFCLLYGVLIMGLWGRFGDPVIDSGLEAYLAMQLSRGGAYFRDFVGLTPPLSLQLNGLLLRGMGAHLSVLYFVGAANGLVFLVSYYLINRILLPRALAYSVTMAVFLHTVCSDGIFNFIFPYCYAMPYASTTFMMSLFFLRMSTWKSERYLFLFSAFLFGLSIAFKNEFVLYGGVLLVVGWKRRFIDIYSLPLLGLVTAAPLVTSLFVELVQGSTLTGIIERVFWIKKFAASPLLGAFYSGQGVYSISRSVDWSLAIEHASLILLGVYFLVIVRQKRFPDWIRSVALLIIGIVIGCTSWSKNSSFAVLGPASYLMYGLWVAVDRRVDGAKRADSTLICWSFMLGGFKTALSSGLSYYGAVFFPYYLAVAVISMYQGLPSVLQRVRRESVAGSLTAIILLLSMTCFLKYNMPSFLGRKFALKESDFRSDQAIQSFDEYQVFYSGDEFGRAIASAMRKVADLRTESSALWVLPEGALINFLLDIRTLDEFANLTPIFFETHGEDYILQEFSRKIPHFIIINLVPRVEYVGNEQIGESYGRELRRRIESLYCEVPIEVDDLLKLYSSNSSDCQSS